MIKFDGDKEDMIHYSDDYILNGYKKDSNAEGSFVFRPHAFDFFLTLAGVLLTVFFLVVGIAASWSIIVVILALIIPVLFLGYGISQLIYSFLLFRYMHELHKNEALRRNLI